MNSGDDEGRYDRTEDRMDYEGPGEGEFGETVNIMDLGLGRAPEPATTNGEVLRTDECNCMISIVDL